MKLKYSCQSNHEAYSVSKAAPFNKKREIFWTVINYSKDLDTSTQMITLIDIFLAWERRMPFMYFKRTDDITKAWIKIWWTDKNGDCKDKNGKFLKKSEFDFSRNPGVLAVAYRGTGDIYFNDALYWSIKNDKSKSSYNLVVAGKHEVGHILGIRHTSADGDIMKAEYNETNDFTGDTDDAIEVLFGHIINHAISEFINEKEPQPLVHTNKIDLIKYSLVAGISAVCGWVSNYFI